MATTPGTVRHSGAGSYSRPMRSALLLGFAFSAVLAVAPAALAKKERGPPRVVFLSAGEGPDAVAATEVALGLRFSLPFRMPGTEADPDEFALETVALPEERRAGATKALAALFKGWKKKKKVPLVVAHLPHGRAADVEAAAVKAGVPLLVTSFEPTTRSRDPKRNVFWAGGLRPQEEALQAMDFAMQPLGGSRPLVVHDDSPRGIAVAEATRFFRHVSQTPLEPRSITAIDGEALASAVSDGADSLLYFGGPVGAETLLSVAASAAPKLPVLLGQGGASRAVPTFHAGKAKTAWAIEARWFEDEGRLGRDERFPLQDQAKEHGVELLSAHERGHRVGLWLRDAFSRVRRKECKSLPEALRLVARDGAAGKPVFDDDGWASLCRATLWHSAELEGKPACHMRKDTRIPVRGMPHVGFFSADRFDWCPGRRTSGSTGPKATCARSTRTCSRSA